MSAESRGTAASLLDLGFGFQHLLCPASPGLPETPPSSPGAPPPWTRLSPSDFAPVMPKLVQGWGQHTCRPNVKWAPGHRLCPHMPQGGPHFLPQLPSPRAEEEKVTSARPLAVEDTPPPARRPASRTVGTSSCRAMPFPLSIPEQDLAEAPSAEAQGALQCVSPNQPAWGCGSGCSPPGPEDSRINFSVPAQGRCPRAPPPACGLGRGQHSPRHPSGKLGVGVGRTWETVAGDAGA